MFIYTISDIVGLAVVALVIVYGLYCTIETAIRELRCKHDGRVIETRACDAICSKCGKNLGFIGSRGQEDKKHG